MDYIQSPTEKTANIPIQVICDDRTEEAGVRLMIKREDMIHPEISGNKWRKLKYNLRLARKLSKDILLTFGGAYSNHIHATAAAGSYYGFKTIGIIRGEAIKPLNRTLQFASEKGMRLEFVSRSDYRLKDKLLGNINFDRNRTYIIPEGGSNTLAMEGTSEIVKETPQGYFADYWAVCCGTGSTIAGMITALQPEQRALGISVLKGDFHQKEIELLLSTYNNKKHKNWSVNTDYHFGGYAKWDERLIRFINDFKKNHRIQLDPIYTGKLVYAIYNLMEQGYFEKGSSIMVVHTGGLQGIAGFNERFGNLIY